jgi:hypothetical protein
MKMTLLCLKAKFSKIFKVQKIWTKYLFLFLDVLILNNPVFSAEIYV